MDKYQAALKKMYQNGWWQQKYANDMSDKPEMEFMTVDKLIPPDTKLAKGKKNEPQNTP